jgi:hypothetical protein
MRIGVAGMESGYHEPVSGVTPMIESRCLQSNRLASLVPPPRRPLVRDVDVLTSAPRCRNHLVPKPQDKADGAVRV